MKMDKRMILNYIMLLILFPLMLKPLTGVFVHELLGVAFILLAIIHCFNNKGWLKKTLNAICKKGKTPQKIGLLIINSLLITSLALVMITGVMISVEFFGFMNIPFYEIFYKIHSLSAQAVLVLSLVHLFMHMKMIKTFFRKRKQIRLEKTI